MAPRGFGHRTQQHLAEIAARVTTRKRQQLALRAARRRRELDGFDEFLTTQQRRLAAKLESSWRRVRASRDGGEWDGEALDLEEYRR